MSTTPTLPDFGDAYQGAREDLLMWKRRAQKAEQELRAAQETASRLVAELNATNGPMRMGEPSRAALTQGAGEAVEPVARAEGIHHDAKGTKCPITGRPYFMHLNHPEFGLVPTYGGPYDSYTVPRPDGEPSQPWHERELLQDRYDHDEGGWTDCSESIPLRIIHTDVLYGLESAAELPAQQLQQAVARAVEKCAAICERAVDSIWEYHEDNHKRTGVNVCTNLAAAIRAKGTHQ